MTDPTKAGAVTEHNSNALQVPAVNQHEELKRQINRACQERDDWKMDVLRRDEQIKSLNNKYDMVRVDLYTTMQRAETAEQQKDELLKALEDAEEIIYHLLNVAESNITEEDAAKYKRFMLQINAAIAKIKRGEL